MPSAERRTKCSAILPSTSSASRRSRRSSAPRSGNVLFDGAGGDEDFGLEEITGNPDDRYKFRTAPLQESRGRARLLPQRRVHGPGGRDPLPPQRHRRRADVRARYVRVCRPDLAQRLGPPIPVKLLDPGVREPTPLNPRAFEDLVNFVRNALHDPRVNASTLCRLVPAAVPSGMPVPQFEACR